VHVRCLEVLIVMANLYLKVHVSVKFTTIDVIVAIEYLNWSVVQLHFIMYI